MPGPLFEPPEEFATDTNYPAGSNPWNGNPTRVAPSAGPNAAGLEPEETLPAPWWNYFIGRLTAWVKYLRGFVNETDDEFAYPVTKSRELTISAHNCIPSSSAGIWGSSWTVEPITEFSIEGNMYSTADEAVLFKDLSFIIPTGSQLDEVAVIVKPGAARAVASNRMKLVIFEQSHNFTTPALAVAGTSLGADADNGTTGVQLLELTGLAEILVEGKVYFMAIIAGDDGGAHNADEVSLIRFKVTEISPSQWGG